MITNHTDAELTKFMQRAVGKTMTDEPDEPDFDIPDFGDQEGLAQMGKMGLTVYRAVLRDGGTENEAFSVTAAFFAGIGKATKSDED